MNLYAFIEITLAGQTQDYLFSISESSNVCKDFNLFRQSLEIIKRDEYLNQAMAHAENLIDWQEKEDQEIVFSVTLSRTTHFKANVLGNLSKRFSNKAALSGYLARLQMKKQNFPKEVKAIKASFAKADRLMRAKAAAIPLFLALGFWGFCAMDGATIYTAPVMGAVTLAFILSFVVHLIGVRMNHQALTDRDYAINHGLHCCFKNESKQSGSTSDLSSDPEDIEVQQPNDPANPPGKELAEPPNPRKKGVSGAVYAYQFFKWVGGRTKQKWAKTVDRVNRQQQRSRPAP